MCAIKISWNLSPSNCPAKMSQVYGSSSKVATCQYLEISWKISKSPVEFFKWPIRTMYRKPLYWMGRENYIYVFLMFPDVSVDFPNQPIRWLVSLVTMQRGTPSDWMETAPLNLRHQLSPTCSGLKSWMRFMTSRSMSMSCQTKAVRNGEIRET